MQDYNDGHVFLVYGINETSIERVSDLTSFTRVSQSGDSLQKVSLDVNFDGRDTLTKNNVDLLVGTDYSYRFCIEYEGEDQYDRDTLYLSCSETRSFTTN